MRYDFISDKKAILTGWLFLHALTFNLLNNYFFHTTGIITTNIYQIHPVW